MILLEHIFNSNEFEELISSPIINAEEAILDYYHNKYDDLLFKPTHKEDYKIVATNKKSLDNFMRFFKNHKVDDGHTIKIRTNLLSSEDILSVFIKYKDDDFTNCVYINVDDGSEIIPFKKFMDMMNPINDILKKCDKELSMLEKVLVIYNEVKKNIYKVDENDIHSLKSRLLSEVLTNTDKYIVCAGFVKIFNEVLNINNIKCCEYRFKMKENDIIIGHDVSIINICDKKYGINGLYFFDITRDSYNMDEINNDCKFSGFLLSFDDFKRKYDVVSDEYGMAFYKNEYDINYIINSLLKDAFNESLDHDAFSDINKDKLEFVDRFMMLDYNLYEGSSKIGYDRNIYIDQAQIYNHVKEIKETFGRTVKSDDERFIHLLVSNNYDNLSTSTLLRCLLSRGVDNNMNATKKILNFKK